MALKIVKNFVASNTTTLTQDNYDKAGNQLKLIIALADLHGVDLEDFECSKYNDTIYFSAAQCQKIYKKCSAKVED